MSKDSAIFFGGILICGLVGFALILVGTARMISVENDIKAVARIYRPGGCELAGRVESIQDSVVFKCGEHYDIVIWK
jgi:hypothetical protein